MGERRSSGMSAPHATYVDENYLIVDVNVTDVKEGCALGLVLEHMDEDLALIAAENVSIYMAPRAHHLVTSVKGRRLRIKWILTGVKPSSTFGVVTEGISSIPVSTEAAEKGADPKESLGIDLSTFQGLRNYVQVMKSPS
jgi:hypothetical protein